jgi:hypothetical protein
MNPNLLTVLIVIVPVVVWWRTRSIRAAFVILAVVLITAGFLTGLSR